MEQKQTILVIGLGRFGISICEELVESGQYVIAADLDKEAVEKISPLVDFCAQLDATDEDLLVKIGAKEADIAVVAIGSSIEASILITTILRGLGIPRVISRARTPLHAKALARVGAHKVVFPERDMGRKLADLLVHPWLSTFSPVPGYGFLVGEMKALPSMLDKPLAELDFQNRYNGILLLLERDGERFLPRPGSLIREGDRLLVAGMEEDIEKLIEKKERETNGENGG